MTIGRYFAVKGVQLDCRQAGKITFCYIHKMDIYMKLNNLYS